MDLIGVVDTMFARVDMGSVAVDELRSCPGYGERFEVVRRTVPGFKDLAVACKRLVEQEGCRILVALGMPGKAPIDQVCAHEASQGIMLAQLQTSTHILEVFVHEQEEEDPARLVAVCEDRARKHARNAYWLAYEPEQLVARAGRGVRQGYPDAGPIVPPAPGQISTSTSTGA
jgi:riboflavin synthase